MSLTSHQHKAITFNNIHTSNNTSILIDNIHANVGVLTHQNIYFPYTINHTHNKNSWVCSPYTSYVSYTHVEIKRHFPTLLRLPLHALCYLYGSILKLSKIDNAIAFNNWLISTNIHPDLEQSSSKIANTKEHTKTFFEGILKKLIEQHPKHAIWIRSLNYVQNIEWLNVLTELGGKLISTRQVYLFENIHELTKKHSNLKRDLKLLSTTSFIPVNNDEFSDQDYEKIAALYHALYIEKYSDLNPQYNARFMRAWHQAKLLEFQGFRDHHGILQAVVGTFTLHNTITAPIVGYNTALPQTCGLYRLLMASVFKLAQTRQQRINLSAGAAHFKRLRGGVAHIEYSVVFDQHLSVKRQIGINLLRFLSNKIGKPIMKKYEL